MREKEKKYFVKECSKYLAERRYCSITTFILPFIVMAHPSHVLLARVNVLPVLGISFPIGVCFGDSLITFDDWIPRAVHVSVRSIQSGGCIDATTTTDAHANVVTLLVGIVLLGTLTLRQ